VPRRILVIEDDPDIGGLIAAQLASDDIHVCVEGDGSRGLQLAQSSSWDLFVLDWVLPGTDGVTICRRLRASHGKSPIILLTARQSEADRIHGLDSGADDYIAKPFSIGELMARVRAQLRRGRDVAQSVSINVGDLHLDPDSHSVFVKGRAVSLTPREFDVMHLLMRHPGRLYTREQLLHSVWGPAFDGFAHTVNSNINRLRAKLESNPDQPERIVTVWGAGYRLVAVG
jgi:two-component system, OmpR family, response regulator